MEPEKIEVILKWPITQTLKALRGFLGLTGYYHKFIRNYGKITTPLTKILKQNGFKWDEASESSFEELKHAITTTSILALPNISRQFVIGCDASGGGLGGVLL